MSFKYLIFVDFEATCWGGYQTRKDDMEIIGNQWKSSSFLECNIIIQSIEFYVQNFRPFCWTPLPDKLNRNFISSFVQLDFQHWVIIARIWRASLNRWSINKIRFPRFSANFRIGWTPSLSRRVWNLSPDSIVLGKMLRFVRGARGTSRNS